MVGMCCLASPVISAACVLGRSPQVRENHAWAASEKERRLCQVRGGARVSKYLRFHRGGKWHGHSSGHSHRCHCWAQQRSHRQPSSRTIQFWRLVSMPNMPLHLFKARTETNSVKAPPGSWERLVDRSRSETLWIPSLLRLSTITGSDAKHESQNVLPTGLVWRLSPIRTIQYLVQFL
jgi:hypothetical protein